jgi:hypothetical protein
MSTSNTLAAAASVNHFERVEPHLIVNTVFRAPRNPRPHGRRGLLRGGIVKAEIHKPES